MSFQTSVIIIALLFSIKVEHFYFKSITFDLFTLSVDALIVCVTRLTEHHYYVTLNNKGSSESVDLDIDSEFSDDRWVFRNSKREDMSDLPCGKVHPTPRDIVRRFYAILPYFDKDHSNRAFLHKFRATVYGMSEGDDILDREAAFYASALTPLLFLQQYRDTWCLLERFHRAMRLYQLSHPAEKRAALKLLQNLRAVNHKIKSFIFELPGPEHASRSTTSLDFDDDEIHDKKDIRYLKELIKNLG